MMISEKIKYYRSVCQKNENENYLFDKYIFRKFSIYFTILFIKVRISANQATLLSLIFALLSSYFLTFNTVIMMLLSIIFIFLYYMLDHVDGELARYYIAKKLQQPSIRGQYFDVLVHKYSSNLFLFFIGVSIFNIYGYKIAVLLGFISCIGLSSFPNLIASNVLMQKIANVKNIVNDKKMDAIFYNAEIKKKQIDSMYSSNIFIRGRKILGETLVFPGVNILIIISLLLDLLVGEVKISNFITNFRFLLLICLTPIYLIKIIKDIIKWMNLLKTV